VHQSYEYDSRDLDDQKAAFLGLEGCMIKPKCYQVFLSVTFAF
jgi:hypothetical protein